MKEKVKKMHSFSSNTQLLYKPGLLHLTQKSPRVVYECKADVAAIDQRELCAAQGGHERQEHAGRSNDYPASQLFGKNDYLL